MTRQGFIDFMVSKGKVRDRWGHFSWTTGDGRQVRYKVGKLAVRRELKTPAGWVRIRSAYYRQLTVSSDGLRLQGTKT